MSNSKDSSSVDTGGEEVGGDFTLEQILGQAPPENQSFILAMSQLWQSPEMDPTPVFLEMVGSKLLVPLNSPAVPIDKSNPDVVNLDVITVSNSEGEVALPVFTHPEALQAQFGPDQPSILIPAQSVLELVVQTPLGAILVNLSGPFTFRLGREVFEPLAWGMLPGVDMTAALPTAEEGLPGIYVDLPAEPIPDETVESLCDELARNPGISSAHLFIMQSGEGTLPRLTLGIVSQGPAGQWAVPHVNRHILSQNLSFEPYEGIDVMLLDDNAQAVIEVVPALYIRGSEIAAPSSCNGSATAGEPVDTEPAGKSTKEAQAGNEGTAASVGGNESDSARSRWPFGRRKK